MRGRPGTPWLPGATPPEYPQPAHRRELVSAVEGACDAYNADPPTLRTFIPPGRDPGGRPAARSQGGDQAGRAHRSRPLAEHGETISRVASPSTSTGSRTCCSSSARTANASDWDVLQRPGGDQAATDRDPRSAWVGQVRAPGGGLQPGQEAGQGRVGHGQWRCQWPALGGPDVVGRLARPPRPPRSA